MAASFKTVARATVPPLARAARKSSPAPTASSPSAMEARPSVSSIGPTIGGRPSPLRFSTMPIRIETISGLVTIAFAIRQSAEPSRCPAP